MQSKISEQKAWAVLDIEQVNDLMDSICSLESALLDASHGTTVKNLEEFFTDYIENHELRMKLFKTLLNEINQKKSA